MASAPTGRHRRPLEVFVATRMDVLDLEVVTFGGKRLSLEGLQEAVRFLEDGGLEPKVATDLFPIDSILVTNGPSTDTIKKDIWYRNEE
jgi:hypothetical protein